MPDPTATAAPLKAGWEGGSLRGGFLCPVEGCGQRMVLHLLEDHLSSNRFGGHGLDVVWTIRVSERAA